MPGRVGDEHFARQLASYSRLCASPTTFVQLLEMNLAMDMREALSSIRVPTLVIHYERPHLGAASAIVPVFSRQASDASRYVAERIPGARLVEVPPGDPVVWAVDQSEFLAPVREFLTGAWEAGAWEPAEPDRVLATLLFTDIVGSTERAAELGDARWRDLIQKHHALVRHACPLSWTRDRHGR